MKTATFIAALAGMAFAAPSPHAVTDSIAPAGEKTPDGCSTTYNGKFQVVVQTLNKRDVAKRDSQPLELSLKDGVLTDALGRTGYIASNNQFQFDGPAQAGAIYTAGWSVCANGSIALGNSAIFYQCLSGSFYNLYDEHTAAQCSPVFLNALGSGNAATGTVNNAAVVPTTGVQSVVCQIGDGQIQKDTCITTATAPPTTKPTVTGGIVTQIGDGQIQAPASSGTVAITTPATPKVQIPTGGATPSQNSTVPITTPSPTVATTASTTSARPVNTGAAASNAVGSELFGLVAAVAAVALLV